MAEVPGGASSRPRAQPAAAAGSSGRRSGEAKLASAMQLPAAIDKEGAEVVAPLQLFLEPQLADRGAAEELVDGIDPVGRLPIAGVQAPIVAGRYTGPQRDCGVRTRMLSTPAPVSLRCGVSR